MVSLLIENATEAMDAEEVPDTGRVIFMSEEVLQRPDEQRKSIRTWQRGNGGKHQC